MHLKMEGPKKYEQKVWCPKNIIGWEHLTLDGQKNYYPKVLCSKNIFGWEKNLVEENV